MAIILKFLLKNIQEKKLRTTLILMAIILSTALFFASNAVSTSFTDSIIAQLKGTYGKASIVVQAKDDASSTWVSEHIIKVNNKIKQVIGVNTSGGTVEIGEETLNFTLFGADLDKLKQINPFELVNPVDSGHFSGKEIIISEKFANKYRYNEGSTLTLKINNVSQRFKVVGIAKTCLLFGTESEGYFALAPQKTLQEISDSNGKCSFLCIETIDSTNDASLVKELGQDLERYDAEAREAVPAADIEEMLNNKWKLD